MMARKVFFSFHYARDSWKVSQIRNAHVVGWNGDAQPFLDKAQWESIKRQGNAAIEKWIATQMQGCSVVVVLFGTETYKRPWVQYEIKKAHESGRGILGVSLQGMSGSNGVTEFAICPNPFQNLNLRDPRGSLVSYPTYQWQAHSGRLNMESWIETAAKRAGY